MIEDKLTKDERIRLEALSQAQILHGHGRIDLHGELPLIERVVLDAKELEHFIRTGD